MAGNLEKLFFVDPGGHREGKNKKLRIKTDPLTGRRGSKSENFNSLMELGGRWRDCGISQEEGRKWSGEGKRAIILITKEKSIVQFGVGLKHL